MENTCHVIVKILSFSAEQLSVQWPPNMMVTRILQNIDNLETTFPGHVGTFWLLDSVDVRSPRRRVLRSGCKMHHSKAVQSRLAKNKPRSSLLK